MSPCSVYKDLIIMMHRFDYALNCKKHKIVFFSLRKKRKTEVCSFCQTPFPFVPDSWNEKSKQFLSQWLWHTEPNTHPERSDFIQNSTFCLQSLYLYVKQKIISFFFLSTHSHVAIGWWAGVYTPSAQRLLPRNVQKNRKQRNYHQWVSRQRISNGFVVVRPIFTWKHVYALPLF